MIHNTFVSDLEEELFLLVLQEHFNDKTITKTKGKFAVFDYKNNHPTKRKIVCELKTRSCKLKAFSSTIVGINKIEKCTNPNVDYYFFFQFVDDVVAKIKYDKELFSTFEVKEGGRWDRGKDEIKDYIHIPLSKCEIIKLCS